MPFCPMSLPHLDFRALTWQLSEMPVHVLCCRVFSYHIYAASCSTSATSFPGLNKCHWCLSISSIKIRLQPSRISTLLSSWLRVMALYPRLGSSSSIPMMWFLSSDVRLWLRWPDTLPSICLVSMFCRCSFFSVLSVCHEYSTGELFVSYSCFCLSAINVLLETS